MLVDFWDYIFQIWLTVCSCLQVVTHRLRCERKWPFLCNSYQCQKYSIPIADHLTDHNEKYRRPATHLLAQPALQLPTFWPSQPCSYPPSGPASPADTHLLAQPALQLPTFWPSQPCSYPPSGPSSPASTHLLAQPALQLPTFWPSQPCSYPPSSPASPAAWFSQAESAFRRGHIGKIL